MPRLSRMVSRHTPAVIERLDQLAKQASTKMGKQVTRAAILRALLTTGLDAADRSEDFFKTIAQAIIKRGRKKVTHV